MSSPPSCPARKPRRAGGGIMIDYERCPGSVREQLQMYIEEGRPLGAFVRAVIENDLRLAVLFADVINEPLIIEIVRWLYHQAPTDCLWSPKQYITWMARGGLKGVR